MGQKFSSDEVYDTLRGEDSVCTVYSFLRFLDGSGTWGDYHVCDEETNSVRDHHGRRGRAAPGGRGRVTSAGHATRGDAEAAHDRDGVDEVAGGSSPAGAAQDVDMRRPVVRASTQEEDEVHAYRQSQLKQLIGQVIPKLLHFYVLYSLDQGGASVFRRADVAFFVSHYINSAQYTYACVRKEALHLFFKASAPGGGGSALQSASRGGNQAGGRAAGASAAAGAAPATTDAAAFVSSSAAAAASPSAAVNGGAASHPPRFGSAAAGGTSSSEGSSAAATTGAAPAASSATSTAHAGAPSLAPAAARAGQQTRVAGMSQGAVAYVQIGAGSLARSASGVRSCSGAVGSASRHAGRGGAPGAAAAAVTLAAAAPGSAAPASGHAGAAAAGAAAAPSRSGPGAPLPAPAASQQSQTARQHGAAVVGSGGSPGPASAARPTCGTLPLITPALITRTRNLAKWLCAMVIVRRPPSRGARKPRLIGPSKSGTAASTGGEFLGASAGPPTLTLREVFLALDCSFTDCCEGRWGPLIFAG